MLTAISPVGLVVAVLIMIVVAGVLSQMFPPKIRVSHPRLTLMPDYATATAVVTNDTGIEKKVVVHFTLLADRPATRSGGDGYRFLDGRDVPVAAPPLSSQEVSCQFPRPNLLRSGLVAEAQLVAK